MFNNGFMIENSGNLEVYIDIYIDIMLIVFVILCFVLVVK